MFNGVMNTITLQLLRIPLHVWRRILNMLTVTISDRVKSLLVRGHYLDNLREGTPIIVYQMGKVGSNSIKNSLISCDVKPVFHVHAVNPSHIKMITEEELANGRTPPDFWLGERLYVDVIRKGKIAKFITLVREPVSRNISAFFQSFPRNIGVEYDDSNYTIE